MLTVHFWVQLDEMLGKNYKFYLSFENSLCDDYVTEKFYNALLYNTVPIVFGGANYSKLAPKNSYIDVRNFTSSNDQTSSSLLYIIPSFFSSQRFGRLSELFGSRGWRICEILGMAWDPAGSRGLAEGPSAVVRPLPDAPQWNATGKILQRHSLVVVWSGPLWEGQLGLWTPAGQLKTDENLHWTILAAKIYLIVT